MSSTSTSSPPTTSRLSSPLPPGTWDSHTHVINSDFTRFPLTPTAQYTPSPHSIADAREFFSRTSGLGLSRPRMVLTQVSIYGNDNSALLEGLKDLGPNDGRGLVEFDPSTVTNEQLHEWHAVGVRGARINLVSRARHVPEKEFAEELGRYVSRIVSAGVEGWLVEMFVALEYVSVIQKVLPTLEGGDRVKFVLDHFAGYKVRDNAGDEYIASVDKGQGDPYLIPHFESLVELLAASRTGGPDVYVKVSGQYRVDGTYPSPRSKQMLDPIGKELLAKVPEKCCFATDWPHTRFEKVDSVPFVEWCYEWCGEGEEGMKKRELLFRRNTERLFDVKDEDF